MQKKKISWMKKDIDVGKYKTGYLKGQDSSFPMDNW
jgi:hypothetical protein